MSRNLYITFGVFVGCLILSRFIFLMITLTLNVKKFTCSQKLKYAFESIFMPHRTDFLEEITCSVNVCSKDEGIEKSAEH
jgi:hypothetical protein